MALKMNMNCTDQAFADYVNYLLK